MCTDQCERARFGYVGVGENVIGFQIRCVKHVPVGRR